MKRIPYKRSVSMAFTVLLACLLSSCDKYLDARPDKKLVVPSTLADLQAMIDNYSSMSSNTPGAGEASSADFYLTDADWAARSENDRRTYTWEKDHLFATGDLGNDWSYCFGSTYICNTVLAGLPKIGRTAANAATWDDLKGQALFYRGMNYLNAAWVWCMPYDEDSRDLGLPLRLDPDFNTPSVRSPLKETYGQIISDLRASVALLPAKTIHPVRPGKAAAWGVLARAYLSMRQYAQAGLYADSCLQVNSTLLDYSTLNASASYPIARANAEVVFDRAAAMSPALNPSRSKVDSNLYKMYPEGDLRKTVFFKRNTNGTYAFKGSYLGTLGVFSGIATDEMYLIRAEAYARAGQTEKALADLNTLLRKRWNRSLFREAGAASSSEALQLILLERRKELLMRTLRWMDIKRLNREGAGISLSRKVNGQVYTLPANDLRFALPIPEDVIDLSGMQQNPR
ncbi:RagB/SusD family nutrient uptake outer membrane protein [Arcticibacter tournemirensis]|uniref:RagB/SusD family nutrient uptake outer membrane protein n=1 Tax=Arcticibacter tournemirensis TaxID=699437 RepID=A0A4Q0MBK0_9SPHI|nr:RagB/SusD family nutrient uptake outer membrane protein [Arcticibacter tournemirensis]RXF70544.1 RagB/SusD family nutrient uptake outer membrane protein [Arcticibacter tournemirensis]